ncbi:MAG: hypothetical protein QNK37_20170 [Acidobacteriota bacterium]|nr:hypothetical protein [Acidobacteriota bacterium]
MKNDYDSIDLRNPDFEISIENFKIAGRSPFEKWENFQRHDAINLRMYVGGGIRKPLKPILSRHFKNARVHSSGWIYSGHRYLLSWDQLSIYIDTVLGKAVDELGEAILDWLEEETLDDFKSLGNNADLQEKIMEKGQAFPYELRRFSKTHTPIESDSKKPDQDRQDKKRCLPLENLKKQICGAVKHNEVAEPFNIAKPAKRSEEQKLWEPMLWLLTRLDPFLFHFYALGRKAWAWNKLSSHPSEVDPTLQHQAEQDAPKFRLWLIKKLFSKWAELSGNLPEDFWKSYDKLCEGGIRPKSLELFRNFYSDKAHSDADIVDFSKSFGVPEADLRQMISDLKKKEKKNSYPDHSMIYEVLGGLIDKLGEKLDYISAGIKELFNKPFGADYDFAPEIQGFLDKCMKPDINVLLGELFQRLIRDWESIRDWFLEQGTEESKRFATIARKFHQEIHKFSQNLKRPEIPVQIREKAANLNYLWKQLEVRRTPFEYYEYLHALSVQDLDQRAYRYETIDQSIHLDWFFTFTTWLKSKSELWQLLDSKFLDEDTLAKVEKEMEMRRDPNVDPILEEVTSEEEKKDLARRIDILTDKRPLYEPEKGPNTKLGSEEWQEFEIKVKNELSDYDENIQSMVYDYLKELNYESFAKFVPLKRHFHEIAFILDTTEAYSKYRYSDTPASSTSLTIREKRAFGDSNIVRFKV